MTRKLMSTLVAAVAALGLVACGGGAEVSAPVTEPAVESPSEDPTESAGPLTVTEDEPVTITCGPAGDECLALTFTEIDPSATCPESQEVDSRFVSLKIEAEMPADADPDFTSPFRNSPWAAVTEENRLTQIMSEAYCHGESTEIDLMREFPGYSAQGTAYLPVPDDAKEIHFSVSRDEFMIIPLGAAADEESADPTTGAQVNQDPTEQAPAEQSPAEQPQTAQPTVPTLPAPKQTAQQTPVKPAPVQQPESDPVIGFTGAPGVDQPRPLNKTVASCGDPMIHQTGTTFFTDGTSGWTEQCSQQMMQMLP